MDLKKYIVVSSGNPLRKVVQTAQPRPIISPQKVIYPQRKDSEPPLSSFHDYPLEDCDSDDEIVARPPRKKACLNQLSENEKNLRRKMKNRESAQSARDRKKNHLENLENRVKVLEDEKLTLQQAKSYVDQKCDRLERENSLLKDELFELRASKGCTLKGESVNSQHWESVCRDLMLQKEELANQLTLLQSRLGVKQEAVNEQLDCLVPIMNEVEVSTSEESLESAALSVSPQQNRFLHALLTIASMLLLSTKFPVASGESTTQLEFALKKTLQEGKLDQKSQMLIVKQRLKKLRGKYSVVTKKPP